MYTLQHFLQLALRGKFARIDLGPVKNMRRYGQVNPPEYNLKNVQVPTKLYVGDSDILTKPKNVEKVRKILPSAGTGYPSLKARLDLSPFFKLFWA